MLAYSSDLALEYKFCEECKKAYLISLPHECMNSVFIPIPKAENLKTDCMRGLQFLCALMLSTMTTAAITSAVFAYRNSIVGLVLSDCVVAAPWVLLFLPLLWTQPSLNSMQLWMFVALVYIVFVTVLYVWNFQGENIAVCAWLIFCGVGARWKLPPQQNDSRFALEAALGGMLVGVLSNLLVRETGIAQFSYGKLIIVPLGLCTLFYDLRHNPLQRNSYAYALLVAVGYISIPIFFTAILQSKFDVFVSMACMISIGFFFNWAVRTMVNWAADTRSGVILMFPLYLAEDLFQTLLFADSNGFTSYRFWGLICAQEGSNLFKHLGIVPILRYHMAKMADSDAIHPYDNPEWVIRHQSLAVQDSVSACVSILVALTAAAVDSGVRSGSGSADIVVFSHETRIDVLASLYSMLLFVRMSIAFLEHVVLRQKFARLRTFYYRTKLLETLNHRRYSAACCVTLSCLVFIDSLKWRSYYLNGWPSATGFLRNV